MKTYKIDNVNYEIQDEGDIYENGTVKGHSVILVPINNSRACVKYGIMDANYTNFLRMKI